MNIKKRGPKFELSKIPSAKLIKLGFCKVTIFLIIHLKQDTQIKFVNPTHLGTDDVNLKHFLNQFKADLELFLDKYTPSYLKRDGGDP